MSGVTVEEATAWCAGLEKLINGGNDTPCKITVMDGPVWMRIVQTDKYSGHAYGFIDKATGDLYATSGWRGPVKNKPRGSIRAPDPYEGCTVFGVVRKGQGKTLSGASYEAVTSRQPSLSTATES